MNPRVLVLEPPNQLLPIDTARPNGALGPAYLVGALRAADIEADYFDGTVGSIGTPTGLSFFNRIEQENGTIRYGEKDSMLAAVIADYDVVATSSIFTAQTRMHFEVAAIAKRVAMQRGKPILTIAGGVNARALRKHFLANNFDIVVNGDGEDKIVDLVRGCTRMRPTPLDDLALPSIDALPLETYRELGIPHAGILPKGTMFASIQTSRGCQDRCTFCHISLEKERGEGNLRMFSDETIGRYVDQAEELGVQRLYFEDDNLFFNKKRLYRLSYILKRKGLEYSNVNGANLRFLFDKGEPDTEFIAMLRWFGLVELVLPFESRSQSMMDKYASGKYNPETHDPIALVKALKRVGIRCQGNFMIGFKDETWASVLRTKEFAKDLMAAGMDAAGFMIPVPYPGSIDFERLDHTEFDKDLLRFTDRMHWRAKPLFPTLVPGEQLEAAVRSFWEELNPEPYVEQHREMNAK